MKMIDISQGWYQGMPSYDAAWYPKFDIRKAMTPRTDPAGGGRTFSDLRIFPHNGTHVESGYHFYEDREKIPSAPTTAAARCTAGCWAPGSPSWRTSRTSIRPPARWSS